MLFWWLYFFFFCGLLIPLVIFLGGRMMWKHPPDEANGIIGYRTRRSMKSPDTWKFANEFCGKLWCKLSPVLLLISILFFLPLYGHPKDEVGNRGILLLIIHLLLLILSVLLTEKTLKKNFTENGDRR